MIKFPRRSSTSVRANLARGVVAGVVAGVMRWALDAPERRRRAERMVETQKLVDEHTERLRAHLEALTTHLATAGPHKPRVEPMQGSLRVSMQGNRESPPAVEDILRDLRGQ